MNSGAHIPFDLARGRFVARRPVRLDFPRFAQGACDWGLAIGSAGVECETNPISRARRLRFGIGDWRRGCGMRNEANLARVSAGGTGRCRGIRKGPKV